MRRTVSKLILLGVAGALLLLAQPVSSQDGIPIVDLGPAIGTGIPSDLNSRGDVVGWHNPPGGDTAHFLWTADNGWVDLRGTGLTYTYVNDLRQVATTIIISETLTQPMRPVPIIWDGGEETTLGDLGGDYAFPCDINEAGEVAGQGLTDQGHTHAFLWTPAGGMQDLGTLGGLHCTTRAMNDSSWVVGDSLTADGEYHAFLWTPPAGGMRDLGTLGGNSSRAYDVNNVGQVVGASSTTAGVDHAFLWTTKGGMIDLGTLGGSYSAAFDISESGHVVGWSDTAGDAQRHAFLWTASGGMQDLGALSGGRSRAARVSNSGQVVGFSYLDTGVTRAFTWTRVSGMIDLGTLPGGRASDAVDVNEQGQVVGWSFTPTGARHAVLWTVVSPAQLIEEMIGTVAALVDDGVLPSGASNGLIQKLENAARLLEAENTGAACNQLQAFVNQVEAFAKSGRLPADVVAQLTSSAGGIIAQLCP